MKESQDNHSLPPGWSHNPSAWGRRLPLAGLALAGFGIALYLALFQWRVFAIVWEPFFGEGSRKVLQSSLSRLLPIPDAAFGAIAYFVEAVADLIGGRERWHTAPWSVVLFGALAGALALGSIVLVIVQGAILHAWCTLCLCSAVSSLLIAGPALSEWRAASEHLRRRKRDGHSAWDTFWGLEHTEL